MLTLQPSTAQPLAQAPMDPTQEKQAFLGRDCSGLFGMLSQEEVGRVLEAPLSLPWMHPCISPQGIFHFTSSLTHSLVFYPHGGYSCLGHGFLWGERGVKHNNFYPKQEIGPWTPTLTYHLSRSGSVLGAWSSPHQCPLPHPQTLGPHNLH